MQFLDEGGTLYRMSVRQRIRTVKPLRARYCICVLESPNRHFNLAAAYRNVSAFGIEKMYIVGGYPTIPKSFDESRNDKLLMKESVGANRWVFIKHFATTAECIRHLKKNSYVSIVTSPHCKGKENIELYRGDFTQKRLAVWFGSEGKGISQEAIDHAESCIQIPMAGIVESLNLGTSTGIVLSYIAHQRLGYVQKKKPWLLKKAVKK